MLKIKDYLVLKEIYYYLCSLRDFQIRDNDGFSNLPINELDKMILGLDVIIQTLEKE